MLTGTNYCELHLKTYRSRNLLTKLASEDTANENSVEAAFAWDLQFHQNQNNTYFGIGKYNKSNQFWKCSSHVASLLSHFADTQNQREGFVTFSIKYYSSFPKTSFQT